MLKVIRNYLSVDDQLATNETESDEPGSYQVEVKSDEPGPSRTMEPIQYDFIDYEICLDEETLQERPTEHDPNKPWCNDFDL